MAPKKKMTKQRKNRAKMAKLEAFLDDFDSEVRTIIETLKEKNRYLVKEADNSYNMALIKLTKSERTMNWLEHCRSGSPKPQIDLPIKVETDSVEKVLPKTQDVPPKTAKKASSKQTVSKASTEDEENIPIRGTVKKGRAKKPPTTSKRAKALSVAKQTAVVTRSGRNALVTPCRSAMNSSQLVGATPLFTPRFDPRLPKTPALRNAQHKERVYSISANGSPITGNKEEVIINVPVGNGECIQLLASQMDSADLTLLDEKAMRSIRMLQNRLTTLCGPSD